jgi:glycosyltransferase involved in cell wall biosynthesis
LQIGTGAHKNLLRLAEALQGRNCFLQIVGRLNEIQRLALRSSGVEYENVIDISDSELIALYEQADLVAFTSLAEGFGMPIVEGQAIGRPVLTSNLSPMKEVAGLGACLANPYSVAEIRMGLDRIITDESYRNRLVEAGFANVKRFDPYVVARQYAALYRRVAAQAEHTAAPIRGANAI